VLGRKNLGVGLQQDLIPRHVVFRRAHQSFVAHRFSQLVFALPASAPGVAQANK